MKKQNILQGSFLAILFCLSLGTFAQSNKNLGRTPSGHIRCSTVQYEEHLLAKYPKRQTTEDFEKWIAPKVEEIKRAQSMNKNVNTIITIPVVIHIISNGDAVGSNENITNAQALSQITVLNQDFRKMLGTPGYNTNAVGADMEIQFVMAQRKPDGVTATNGIDRVTTTKASYTTEAQVETMKTTTIWDPTQYFNIWTVYFSDNQNAEMNGILGYAQFPVASGLQGLDESGAANTDGLVIDYRCFGSSDIAPGNYFTDYDKGRTSTHEIGHCFGLRHIWGDAGSQDSGIDCSGTDYCADTPNAGWEHYDCTAEDSCPSSPGTDMIQNYMDYTNDTCMNIFTLDQKNRVAAVMANSPRRVTLATSSAGLPLGVENFATLNNFQLYPNPAKSTLKIKTSELPDSFAIYNNLGQVIQNKNTTTDNDLTLDISGLTTGVYFIKITKTNQVKTLRFIKE